MKTFFGVMIHASSHQAKCSEMYFLKAIPLPLFNAVGALVLIHDGIPRSCYEIKWAHVRELEWYHILFGLQWMADAAIATKSLDRLNLKPLQLNSPVVMENSCIASLHPP